MSKRRECSPEFKREAVELSRTPGVTVAQIVEELGISAIILSRWRREQAAAGEKAFQGHGKARDVEMARLKRELERVNRRKYRTRAEVRADAFDCIERFHNPRRRRQLEAAKQKNLLLTQASVETG